MQRVGRVARWAGLVLIGVAVILAVLGWAIRWRAEISAVDEAERLEAPGELTMKLDPGRHGIWVEQGRGLAFYDVTIEGPRGDVRYADYGMFGSSATLTLDGTAYRMDGHFDVSTGGRHTIRFEKRANASHEIASAKVAVGPNDNFAFPIPTFLAWLAAALCLLLGSASGSLGVLLGIIGRRQAGTGSSPPPGPAAPPGPSGPPAAPTPRGPTPPPPGPSGPLRPF